MRGDRLARWLCLLSVLFASASRAAPGPGPEPAPTSAEQGATALDAAPPAEVQAAYLRAAAELESRRAQLAADLRAATSPPTRAELRARASATLHEALAEQLLPRWVGTAWGGGATADAQVPLQAGHTVHCGSFVIAALRGAGLRFFDGDQLAQAPALRMLEAVAPEAIVRWRGSAAALRRALVQWGPGVYLLGMSRHIGFAIVDGETVQLVHASERAGHVVTEDAEASTALRARSAVLFIAQLSVGPQPSTGAAGRGARPLLQRGAATVLQAWLDRAVLGPQ